MPTSIIWSPALSVGNHDIDEQHRCIIDMANKFAHLNNVDDLAIYSLLDAALFYTLDHFRFEESLLRDSGYPQLEAHKFAHDEIRLAVMALQINHDIVTRKLINDLMATILAHITQEDRGYIGLLNSS